MIVVRENSLSFLFVILPTTVSKTILLGNFESKLFSIKVPSQISFSKNLISNVFSANYSFEKFHFRLIPLSSSFHKDFIAYHLLGRISHRISSFKFFLERLYHVPSSWENFTSKLIFQVLFTRTFSRVIFLKEFHIETHFNYKFFQNLFS